MKQLRPRLRDQRDSQPQPVWIWYGRGLTSRAALEAAIAAGMVPENSAIVLLPQQAASREEWQRDCQAEEAERQRQRAEVQKQQEAQVGTKPDGHS